MRDIKLGGKTKNTNRSKNSKIIRVLTCKLKAQKQKRKVTHMSKVYYFDETKSRDSVEVLERIGAERFSTYNFEVVAETPKGAILQCLDNPMLSGFLYCSLPVKSVVIASIHKAIINRDGKPFISLRLESVKSYGDACGIFSPPAA